MVDSKKAVYIGAGLFLVLLAVAITIVVISMKKPSDSNQSPGSQSPQQSTSSPPTPPSTQTSPTTPSVTPTTPTTPTTPAAPQVSFHKPFVIQQVKDGVIRCVDDSGVYNRGGVIDLRECNGSVHQQFIYDPDTRSIYNINKPNPGFSGTRTVGSSVGYLCMDDVGATADPGLGMHYWPCESSNRNQPWMIEPETQANGTVAYRIRNPLKTRCLSKGVTSMSCVTDRSSPRYAEQVYNIVNV